MKPATNALLVCAVFLCRLEETVLSQHGRCTGNQCFAFFQQPGGFTGARKSCQKDPGAQLFVFDSKNIETMLTGLPSSPTGSYWLDGRREEAAADLCPSISIFTGRNLTVLWEPCAKNLSGYLCQYKLSEPCSGLKADAQVTYIAAAGFEVHNSETFPQGTIAAVKKAGAEYPDSKQLCVSSTWLQSPWNCEVLNGGCEHGCNSATGTCSCPAGHTLHPNKVSCAKDAKEGDTDAVECGVGFKVGQDGKSCVDVNECEGKNPCTGEGEVCHNTPGHFECRCVYGFEREDGVCVNLTICSQCEHMLCDKFNGVYKCVCRKGFKVSDKDPTKCEMHCTERTCPANCVLNSDKKKQDQSQCFCPTGYIVDIIDNQQICTDINECEVESQCESRCENLFGSYRCLCDKGFRLHKEKEYLCVPKGEEDEEEEEGSSSTPPHPTAASSHPSAVPHYIKTGSVLGISVFVVLCVALLGFLVRNAAKRCGRFELSSVKHPNIDIFYLQQQTTEAYKRLSFDKQLRSDSQII